MRVHFVSLDGLESASDFTCSSDGFAYSVDLYASDYRIEVEDNGDTLVPDRRFEVHARRGFATTTTFDVDIRVPPRVTVSGLLRMNGGPVPLLSGETSGCVRVHFISLDGLDNVSDFTCVSDGLAYAVDVYAGRYRIEVEDAQGTTMLPNVRREAVTSRSFTVNETFDVNVIVPPRIDVSGVVRMNGGAIPLESGASSACLRVRFASLDGLDSSSDYTCTSDGYAYSVSLYAGRYRVVVEDAQGATLLPNTPQEPVSSRTFAASEVFDVDVPVPNRFTVSGVVRMNGAAVPLEPGRTNGCVRVHFFSLDGFDGASAFTCNHEGFAYAVELYAGAYRIEVEDAEAATLLPNTRQEVVASRAFTAAASYDVDVAVPPRITVSGAVTMNGGPLLPEPNGNEACVRVIFRSLDGHDTVDDSFCLLEGSDYSVELYAGAYHVEVVDSGTLLPDVAQRVHVMHTFAGSQSFDIDVTVPPRVAVSGTVHANGAPLVQQPDRPMGCVRVRFVSLEGWGGDDDFVCASNGFAYAVDLYAGVYRVSVEENGYTNLPAVTLDVVERIRIE